jgi:hypothetical protein
MFNLIFKSRFQPLGGFFQESEVFAMFSMRAMWLKNLKARIYSLPSYEFLVLSPAVSTFAPISTTAPACLAVRQALDTW